MNNVVAGIREEELGVLSLEILDYRSRVSDICEKIDGCMERLQGYYEGTPRTVLVSRYNEIQSNYPTIKENLKGYSDELITLIGKMRANDRYLTSMFEGYTNDIRTQIRAQDNNN